MMKDLFKAYLCICFLFAGCNVCFAETLSSVEISSINNVGKIILDTDKTNVIKNKISNNEIELKLTNTSAIENLHTKYDNIPNLVDVSVIQNNHDTYINITGKNVANYQIDYAYTGKQIPINKTKQNFIMGFLVLLATFAINSISKISQNIKNKTTAQLRNSSIEMAVREKIEKERDREFKTIRHSSQNCNNMRIHSESIVNFSNTRKLSTITVPKSFANADRYMDFSQLKQVVNS